jgi:hypothetical protein
MDYELDDPKPEKVPYKCLVVIAVVAWVGVWFFAR